MTLLKAVKQKAFHLDRLFITMLLLIAPLAWLSVSHPQCIQNMSHIISQNIPLFMGFRWLLILALCLGWPLFVNNVASRYGWVPDKTQFWHAQRWKVTLWLAIFELAICENLLLAIIHLLER